MELAVGALLVFEDAEPRRLRPDAPIQLEGFEAAGLAVEVRRHARSFGADKEEVIRAPLSISHAGDPNGRMNSILSLDHRLPPCLSALDPGLAQLPRATVTPIKEGCEQQLWLAQMRRLCLAGDDRDRKRRGPALRASPQAASPGSPRAAILRRRGPRRRSSGSRRRGVRGRSGSGCGRRRSPCAEGADAQLVRRRHLDRSVAGEHRDMRVSLLSTLPEPCVWVKPSA